MSVIEICAVVLGVINVALIIMRSPWNFPFGIAMVVLYSVVFFQARLYSETVLQMFFLVVQVEGWRRWLQHRGADGRATVEALSWIGRLAAVVGTVVGAVGIGAAMTLTSAAAPYWDALVSALSVTAQVLLTLRRIENWLFWIVADIVAIGLYIDRGLHLTAGLYVLFLIMACSGLYAWRRALLQAAKAA